MTVTYRNVANVEIDGVVVGNLVDALMNYAGRRSEILAAVVSYESGMATQLASAIQDAESVPVLQARITELEEILNPPNGIYPYQFLELLRPEQIVAISTSIDPTVIVLRSRLTTIVSPMPFGDDTPLSNGVKYLAAVIPDLFTPEEVARILARQAPE